MREAKPGTEDKDLVRSAREHHWFAITLILTIVFRLVLNPTQ
jgi:hypothetical protein